MNVSSGYPAMPGQPLDYWLSSDMARMAPPTTPSALRDMAWTYGQYRGLAGACTGVAACLLGGGILAAALMTGVPALWIPLLAGGLALAAVGGLVRRLKLPQIAHVPPPGISRGPERVSSGLGLAIFLGVATGAPLTLALSGWLSQGPGPTFAFFAVMALFVLGMASAFVVPPYFAQNARRDFRRYIENTPALRRELEAMSLNWRDPHADRAFGPL